MGKIDDQRLEDLRACAEGARRMNYVPQSDFMVLAAVEADDGRMCAGSNVEIANYSLTKHAEEVAILAAIVGGQDPQGPWAPGCLCGRRRALWELSPVHG